MKRWDLLVFCVVFTAIGGAGGWIASRQGSGSTSADAAEDAGAVVADQRPELPPQTLRNLGVTVSRIDPRSWVRTRDVPAVIERTPLSERPVFAPVGGRVGELRIEPGMVVAAGDTLLTLVREPIPRPTLVLTGEILKPAKEEIHLAVIEMRKTGEEITIVQTELDRIAQYTGKVGGEELPILPRQTAIDLRYALLRAQKAHEQARLELEKHGFTAEQIQAMAEGGAIPNLGEDSWKRALQRNGLWPETAGELLSVLPEKLQRLPWVIATVGELAAGGLIDGELVAWLRDVPRNCAHFLEIGSLLQRGYTVADIKLLHDLDALDPIVEIRAPSAAEAPDWDVVGLDVKPGARVEGGARLVTVLDPREMYLRTEPVGGEMAAILQAVAEGTPCDARPLVAGTGPELTAITIAFVASDPRGEGTLAFARVHNEALAVRQIEGDRRRRSWKLRAGLRYVLRVPVQQLREVYVVPSGAVTSDGPNRVVFVQDGASFKAVEVEIAYRDEEVAVLPINAKTRLFPGDVVVQSGAYALGLALRGEGAQPDAHAGHQH